MTQDHPTRRALVASLFRAHPGEWIDGRDLARVGGYAAWRTRVSECRRDGMVIENDVIREPNLTITRYRYVPPTPQQARLWEVAS